METPPKLEFSLVVTNYQKSSNTRKNNLMTFFSIQYFLLKFKNEQIISSSSQNVDKIFDLILDSIYYLYGISLNLQDLLEVGEKIFTLKRFFNINCNITRKNDRIPPELQHPLERGLTKNKIVKIESMLEEYYNLRGWDNNGIPSKGKLTELYINHY